MAGLIEKLGLGDKKKAGPNRAARRKALKMSGGFKK
jgi:hypothetical protein